MYFFCCLLYVGLFVKFSLFIYYKLCRNPGLNVSYSINKYEFVIYKLQSVITPFFNYSFQISNTLSATNLSNKLHVEYCYLILFHILHISFIYPTIVIIVYYFSTFYIHYYIVFTDLFLILSCHYLYSIGNYCYLDIFVNPIHFHSFLKQKSFEIFWETPFYCSTTLN